MDGDTIRDGIKDEGEGKTEGFRGIDRRFIHFKLSLKKLELFDDIHENNTAWYDEYNRPDQFDITLDSKEQSSGQSNLYKVHSFKADPSTDIILVRAEADFNPQYDQGSELVEVDYRFKLSASEVE